MQKGKTGSENQDILSQFSLMTDFGQVISWDLTQKGAGFDYSFMSNSEIL